MGRPRGRPGCAPRDVPAPMNVMTDAKPAAARRKSPAATVMLLRKLHAYVGMLIAPATIFMAATGILQVYSLHESHAGYTPPPLIEKLGLLHKKQLFAAAGRRGPPPGAQQGKPAGEGAAAGPVQGQDRGPDKGPDRGPDKGKAQGGGEARPTKLSTTLLKAFFAVAALGLIFSTLTGVWIALTQPLRRNLYLVLLVVGTVVPVILAAFSH